jgi:septal ring factor EnvC (AmiA/AmiB activator)
MWNMMCDVMPTISEDSISQRSSQFGDDANFEQLMVSMLDERDKLVDSLKNEQEKTGDLEGKVKDLEKERDSLQRQLNQNLPQVCPQHIHMQNVGTHPLLAGICYPYQRAEPGPRAGAGKG